MYKALIIGGQGMLGSDLVETFQKDWEVISLGRPNIDVTNADLCLNVCRKFKPDVVVNTAAFHRVSECESNPEQAFLVNAVGAFNVARACRETHATTIYISTDYVFDGSKDSFNEFDRPNPLNVYGASKLAGEHLTAIGNPNSYTIRTSWLFGIHQEKSSKGPNFVTQMLIQAQGGAEIKVVNDQIGSPTYTLDLAHKIKEVVEKKVDYGVYHITNSGFCSWYQYARLIVKLSGYNADIHGESSRNNQSTIVRPEKSVMISRRLTGGGIKKLRNWKDALSDYITTNKLKNGKVS